MGRLDDAAKLKVVELRKAGLSFRKIKAVLELQNIKVSAQAIYLYLREFQGRPAVRGRTRAGEAGSSLAVPQGPAKTEGRPKPWNNAQLQNLLREASHQANRIVALEFGKKTPAGSEASPNSAGPVDAGGGGRPEQCTGGKQEEADIQIVSVTSLAQTAQQRTTVGAQASSATSLARRRVTPSPTTNPILAARKRLLDKALSHRAKSFAPMGAPLRRYQPGIGEDLRRDMTRDHEKYNFANDNTFTARQSGAASDPRRVVVTQRPAALSVRCPQPPPRVGVRPPERTTAHLTSSAPRTPLIRLQAPGGGPGMARRDGSGSTPPPKEASKRGLAAGGGVGGGLQDQVHLLATEVRGLGLAVKMLVEQQSRLEREQTQQTRVQRQILGALQVLASRLGPGQSAPLQPDKTPTPPSVPTASASFGEDAFPYSQGAYVPRSPPQNAYSAMGGLEMVEAFKLPELRGTDINGFPPCSNTEPLSHAYAQTQPYTTAYTQTRGQMTVPCYTQSLAQPYAQGSAPFRGPDAKVSDFPSSCLQVSLQNCNIHTELEMNSTQSSRNDQLNIIKVEDT